MLPFTKMKLIDVEEASTPLPANSSTGEAIDYCEDFWFLGAIRVTDLEDLIRHVNLSLRDNFIPSQFLTGLPPGVPSEFENFFLLYSGFGSRPTKT